MSVRSPFDVMREEAAIVLERHGIRFRKRVNQGVTYYNMERCPLCQHRNYQCAVSEGFTSGKLIHGVKCWHIGDNGFGTTTPDYEDFLYVIGELTSDEVMQVKRFVPNNNGYTGGRTKEVAKVEKSDSSKRPLNLEFHQVLRKRLRENKQALSYLKNDRGLTIDTVERFGLGLSKPYRRSSGEVQDNALVYPMIGKDGKFYNKYGYYNIPGVTTNPVNKNGWMSGDVRTYYAQALEAQQSIFICEGVKDIWSHWQALQENSLNDEILLITSTHGSAQPACWKNPDFWGRWDKIYFGHDNDEAGEQMALSLATYAGRDVYRVRVPKEYGKDWTDFWQSGGNIEEFRELLETATIISRPVRTEEPEPNEPGEFPYAPIDINGAFNNGHLYYPARIVKRQVVISQNDTGEEVVSTVESLETVVVRSDRTVHTAIQVKAPKGTKEQDRVVRLSDGTLIDREPQPNKYGTWAWTSIKSYLNSVSGARPLIEILRDVDEHLRSSVWLPYDEDYAILTLAVPVTYTQSIFDSVPLIFLNGPPGSGKSETGRAMARICANAYVCGTASAASIARFIDESRGFVVLDDLEAIGNKGGEFSELIQALKQSYNKETAVKLWTDIKTMRTHRLNFYGVKMINNTQGTDQILGSRMLRIQTDKISDGMKKQFQEIRAVDNHKLVELRNELHTWAFENVALVDTEYRRLYPKKTDRADEIHAPLKIMAALSGDVELSSKLEIALTRQKYRTRDLDDPREVLYEALKNLIAQGYKMISITHLVLEMRNLLHQDYGKSWTNELPEWARPEWVGRMLRTHNLLDDAPNKSVRKRVFGVHLRFYPINSTFIAQVRDRYAADGVIIEDTERDPTSFCNVCDTCQYRNNSCHIMEKRLADEGRLRREKLKLVL